MLEFFHPESSLAPSLRSKPAGDRGGSPRQTRRRKPALEVLEDRRLLSIGIDMGPIVNPANGHTYYRLTQSNWTDAENYAVTQLGGHLATINDAAENDWVFSTFGSPTDDPRIWIGLNDLSQRFVYSWASGEPVTYTNWAPGQPSFYGNGPEDCVELKVEVGGISQWNDLPNADTAGGYPGGTPMKGIVEVDTAPDLVATSLTWSTTQGGVDFGYQVNTVPLPQDTSAALYWASGTTEDTILEPAATPVTIPSTTPVGQPQTIHMDQQDLQSAPPDAKYLLAELDPNNAIAESDETNNIAFVAYDPITMDSATSPNSKSISFSYDISEAEPGQPITVGIYRSNSPTFDGNAIKVDEQTVPAQDSNGGDSEAVGPHTVDIQDPNALLPDPTHEYVYVVADPDHNIGDPTGAYHEAHYQKFVVGVVVHGFDPVMPQWEKDMAGDLTTYAHFDDVIAFDWSSSSILPIPGVTQFQGTLLAIEIAFAADLTVASQGHPGVDVVDLDLIGHSRGSVVISQALQDLDGTTDSVLAGGYKAMTMLDPHPANNSYATQTASFGSFSQPVVEPVYRAFQFATRDPQVLIPPNVDQVNLYYQHTPASAFKLFGPQWQEAILNLWGEDPSLIINDSSTPLSDDNSEDLTNDVYDNLGPVGHSEVPLWYDLYVVKQGAIFSGYSTSDSSVGISTTLIAAIPHASPSTASGTTGPQAGNSSLSDVRPVIPSPIQVAGSPIADLSGRRPVTDALAQSANATNQEALPTLVLALGDAPAGQVVVVPPAASGPEAQTLIGSPAGVRRLWSSRRRLVIPDSSASQGITRSLVRTIGNPKTNSSSQLSMIRNSSSSGGVANDSPARDSPIDHVDHRA
jgi:hypothetical protein